MDRLSIKFLDNWKYSGLYYVFTGQNTFCLNIYDESADTIFIPSGPSNTFLNQILDLPNHLLISFRDNDGNDAYFFYDQGNWIDVTKAFPAKTFRTFIHANSCYFTFEIDGLEVIYKGSKTSNGFALVELSTLLHETQSARYFFNQIKEQIYLTSLEDSVTRFYKVDGHEKPQAFREYPGLMNVLSLDSSLHFIHSLSTPDSTVFHSFDFEKNQLGPASKIFGMFKKTSSVFKFNDDYFFTAITKNNYDEIWYYSKDSGFRNFQEGSNYSIVGVINNQLIFQNRLKDNHYKIYATDGTVSGTVPFKPLENISTKTGILAYEKHGKQSYFCLDDSTHGAEFWITDGTDAGTKMVADLLPGMASSNPRLFIRYKDSIYFIASPGYNAFLYICDTLGQSIRVLSDSASLKQVSLHYQARVLNDKLIFSYRTNTGNQLLGTFNFHTGEFNYLSDSLNNKGTNLRTFWLSNAAEIKNSTDTFLYINIVSNELGGELWRFDGTKEGTYLVKDIFPGLEGGDPYFITQIHDTLYFSANDPKYGAELWQSYTGCLHADFEIKSICKDEFSSIQSIVNPFNQKNISKTWHIGSDTLFGDSIGYTFTKVGIQTVQLQAGNNQCSMSISKNVFVGQRSTSQVQINSDSLCMDGHQFEITVSDSNQAKTFQWIWQKDTIRFGRTSSYTYPIAGNYQVSMRASEKGSCIDTLVLNLFVIENPAKPTISGPMESFQAIDTLYSTYYPNTTYQWSSDAGQLTKTLNDSSAIFKWDYPTGFATVRLTLENQFGCLSKQSSLIVQRKQLQSLINQEESSLLLYPNPTNDLITLQALNQIIQSVKVFDMNGKLLMEKTASSNQSEMNISLSSLPAGIYMVQVQVNGQRINRIISKE